MSVTTVATIHGYGLLAARPAAGAVPIGTYYFATDTGLTYRSNGTTWDTQTPTAGTPSAHASSHHSGGGDALALASIAGALVEAQTPLTTKGDVLSTDGTNLGRLAAGTDGHVLTADSTQTLGIKWAAGGGGGGGGAGDYILIRDEKATTVEGGTFTSGAWRTRDLNTEVADTGGHASVASNQITLAAGTYRVSASAPTHNVTRHQTRLRDITNGVTLVLGTTGYSVNASAQDVSFVVGRFTLSGSTVIELQHRCTVTQATVGFGVAGQSGETEVYAVVELIRE